MEEIRRKKTFGRVFYESYKKEFHIAGIVLSIIAAITIITISAVIFVKLGIFSGIINFLFDGNNFSFAYKVFITFWIEILSLFIILLLVMQLICLVVLIPLISGSIISGIYNFISKCKTMKRYADLPITPDEVRALIDEGVITTDRDYIYYLTDKLTYKHSGDNYCLKFTDEDMEKIINTYEKVFNKPLILDSEYYKKYRYSWVPDSIPDVIWSTRCPFNYKDKIDEIYREGREAGANPVVFVHKDNSFEKIENANYIYIDSK